MDDLEFHRRLRRLIGRRCRHLGRNCRVVEVLMDIGSIVLSCNDGVPPIQSDQFGQPLRRAAESIQIPLFGDTGDELSDELMELLHQMEPESN